MPVIPDVIYCDRCDHVIEGDYEWYFNNKGEVLRYHLACAGPETIERGYN